MGAFTTNNHNTGPWTVTGNNYTWGNTTASTNDWIITSTSGAADTVLYPNGGWGSGQRSCGVNDLKEIAKEARKWAEKIVEKSPNFNDLRGMCALASRRIHKELKKEGVEAKLSYLNNASHQHVFILVPGKTSGNEVTFKEDHIVDATASLFGEDDVCVLDIAKYDPLTHPWWTYEHAYTSESGLISRQKKDKWPTCQITIQAAKTKQTKFEFVMMGTTDIERGLIRIQPFDVEAVKYLKQQSRGKGIKSNLAALILDADKQIADSALAIAIELLNR
jgi:hypothetical protein